MRQSHLLIVVAALGCGASHGGAHDMTLPTTTGVPCAGVMCAPCADQFCDTADFGKTGTCRAHVSATNLSFGCDGPEDCGAQGVFGACCLLDGIGAACSVAGCGANGRFMCHADSQCAPGEHCCPLSSTTTYSVCGSGAC